MIDYKIGEFCASKCGRDKGNVYIIIERDGKYIYVVDGKCRKIAKPKRKKRIHLQIIHKIDSELKRKIDENEKINDNDIANAIDRRLNK